MTDKKRSRRPASPRPAPRGPAKTGSLKEVAQRAGTSIPTASRVLNGLGDQYRISRATQDRVRQAAAALHFSPNLVAKGLRLGSTRTIGLVVPDIANPFFAAIARAVSAAAHARGYSVLLGDAGDDVAHEIELITGLLTRQPDGLVVIPVGQQCDHLKQFESSPLPVVLVDRGFPLLRLPSVMSDSRQGSFAAVSHLISRGHRRIACIRGLAGTMPDDLRMQGYRDALAEHGIRFDARLVTGTSFGKESGRAGVRSLLASGVEFTAIFAFSNLVGIGALESLLEAGIKVPADVSLVSFDEQPYSGVLAVPMTTVRQDPAEIGRLAIEMLCRRIENPAEQPPASVVVPTTLVPRDSVATLRAP
jgi:LacI family transcriptional regulator